MSIGGYSDQEGSNVIEFPIEKEWLLPAVISPRQWMLGKILLKRNVTMITAPGGVGKTAFATATIVSMLTGRKLLGMVVHRPCNVLSCNLEDGPDEFNRRMAAVMKHNRITQFDFRGKLHTIDGRSERLTMSQVDPDNRTSVLHPHLAGMIAFVRVQKIDVIVVDPFVNSHELDENSNPQMNAAVKAWNHVAEECDCAVLIIHHTRKGAIAGDPDSARGAGSMIGAVRVNLTVSTMCKEEAEQLGVPEEARRRTIRLDDAKQNLTPAGDALWFQLQSVALDNGDDDYPNGDHVQACEPWAKPDVFANISGAQCNRCLDKIQEGPSSGGLYSPSKRGATNARWVGTVLISLLDANEGQAKAIVATWLKNGLLVETEYVDKAEGKRRQGVDVNDAKRPS